MDLRQLEYFVAVAEEASFTRGARRLHSAQSAASASVARLEREIGQPLFVRRARRLDLTEAGRLLLARARSIQQQAREARSELDALRNGLSGTLTIGTILAFGSTVLPHALGAFHRRFPEVAIHVRLSAGPIEQHLDKIEDGTFDLALVPVPGCVPRGIAIRHVELVRLGLACPAGHPLAHVHGVSYRQLVNETFIDFPFEWGNRTIVDSLFTAEECAREVAIEVTNVAAALTLVAGGLGLSFMPEQFIESHEGIAAVDLHRPPPSIPLGAAIAAGNAASAAARALFGLLAEQLPAPHQGSRSNASTGK
ncbi:MAG: LysR family transcriptional regulator [Pseudonocardia sp.]|nr:LysR family transcriptional regulator [Pseudonocardia sp.]